MATARSYSGNGHTVTIADPENIESQECLLLALTGVENWNAWRSQYPCNSSTGKREGSNYANFSGIVIENNVPNFAGFEFGAYACFDDLIINSNHEVIFNGARFGIDCSFERSQFGRASFVGAIFGAKNRFIETRFKEVNFSNAQFAAGTRFEGVISRGVGFDDALFGQWCNFEKIDGSISLRRAKFSEGVSFSEFRFKHANFTGAKFGSDLVFRQGTFERDVDFSGCVFGSKTRFININFEGAALFYPSYWNLEEQSDVDAYLKVPIFHRHLAIRDEIETGQMYFFGTSFAGRAVFSERRFSGALHFGPLRNDLIILDERVIERHPDCKYHENDLIVAEAGKETRFSVVPEFFDCDISQDTSFEGASFPVAQGREEAARAYRTLKVAFAQQQATREEQRFFRLEMAEEALMALPLRAWLTTWWQKRRLAQVQQVEMLPPRFLYRLYAGLSHFGFSIARPLWLLAAALLLALVAYGVQAGLRLCSPFGGDACNMTGPLIQFGFAHALPGFEKLAEPASKVLFGEHGEKLGVWTVLTLLLHKLVSVMALFLAGLGLRNLFKMK
jgi:uncharacterized protein YjbI with pentapeptide repeats